MEKIVVNKEASELRTSEIIKTVHNIANNYAKKGYDRFRVRVGGTLNEFWNASLELKKYNIHIMDDNYTHNNEYGNNAFTIATFIIK